MWQAHWIKNQLHQLYSELDIELVPMTTSGDNITHTSLKKVAGKGLFVKGIENALLEGRADIAVHSMKDMPMVFPEGLGLSVISKHGDPSDTLISNHYSRFDQLPIDACIDTFLPTELFLPADRQGAIGIEKRLEDLDTIALTSPFQQPVSARKER